LGAIDGKVSKNFQKPLKNPPNHIDLMEKGGYVGGLSGDDASWRTAFYSLSNHRERNTL
jgi:hypothetical protein